jgi:hypothetical protein
MAKKRQTCSMRKNNKIQNHIENCVSAVSDVVSMPNNGKAILRLSKRSRQIRAGLSETGDVG